MGEEQTSIICRRGRNRCGGQTPSSTVHTQHRHSWIKQTKIQTKDNKLTDTGTQINTQTKQINTQIV